MSAYSEDSDTNSNIAEAYTAYTSAMPEKPYEKSKMTPSPAVPAKKVEPQVNRVESEASNAEQGSLDDQKEYNTRTYTGLSSPGGIVEPARKKGRSKVPKHSEGVESLLKPYEEDRAEQDQEEEEEEEEEGGGGGDTQEYSGLGTRFEGSRRNRGSKAKLSHTDDFLLGISRPIDFGGRFDAIDKSGRPKKIPRIPEFQYSERIGIGGTDGQLGAKVNGGRPKETPFRMPELQSSRSTGIGGTGGQLGARIKSGSSKETPARIPEPQYGRPIGYEGTGGQLGAKVKSGRRKKTPAKMPELQSNRPTETGGTGGQLGAQIQSGRPKKIPAKKPELQSNQTGGTFGQLIAKDTSGRSKETPARRLELQSNQTEDTGGRLVAKDTSGRPKEPPTRRPGLSKAAEFGGQLGAKVTSDRPKEPPARRLELQSSSSRVQSESSLMNTKGPVAGKRDAPQAPTGFRVTRDQASNVEYLEELDSGDDKETLEIA